jgi:hypothetical protein
VAYDRIVRGWVLAVVFGCGRIKFEARPADAPTTPIGFVQIAAPGYQMATSVTVAITPTVGDLLVAATYWHTSPDTISLSDSSGLAWQPLDIAEQASCQTEAQLWYAPTTVAGPDLVTVRQSIGTRPLGLMIAEYSAIDLAAPIDAHVALAAPIATDQLTTGVVTPTHRALVVAFFNDTNGGGMMVPGASWTPRAWDLPFYVMLEDDVPDGASAAVVPDGALPSGHNDNCWVGVAAAFRVLL